MFIFACRYIWTPSTRHVWGALFFDALILNLAGSTCLTINSKVSSADIVPFTQFIHFQMDTCPKKNFFTLLLFSFLRQLGALTPPHRCQPAKYFFTEIIVWTTNTCNIPCELRKKPKKSSEGNYPSSAVPMCSFSQLSWPDRPDRPSQSVCQWLNKKPNVLPPLVVRLRFTTYPVTYTKLIEFAEHVINYGAITFPTRYVMG